MSDTYSITDRINEPIGKPAGAAVSFENTNNVYDIAIGGQPFILAASDKYPYQRATAVYRKQQFDNQPIPGEQSFEGWWLRSQSGFHCGSGVKYLEQYGSENVYFRFQDSLGLNVWERGQANLLNDVVQTHNVTGTISPNGRPNQQSRTIVWSGIDGALMWDEYDVDKLFYPRYATVTNKALTSNVATLTTALDHHFIVGMQAIITGVDATFNGEYRITSVPTPTTFTYAKTATNVASQAATGAVECNMIHYIDYNSGTDNPVYAIADDGTYAYWVTNNTSPNKLAIYRKLLTADSTTAGTLMYNVTGTVATNAVLEFTKERLVACINNKVYELDTAATGNTSLPTPVYTHPSTDYLFTAITSSGAAIYVSGYRSHQSTIQKFTLTTAGAMPTLSSAITAAEFPPGELVHKIYYYLGLMCIGTSKGIRVATVNDQDGSLNYGPLIVELIEQPCYDFTARDRFVWAATSVNGSPGLIRMDLSQEIENLRYAYANDLSYDSVTGHYTTSCALLGNTDQMFFTSAAGSVGYGYCENLNSLRELGSLTTGFIRYSTIEKKHFKLIKPRIAVPIAGSIALSTVKIDGSISPIITLGSNTDYNSDISTNLDTPLEEVAFKFDFRRDANDVTKGPELNGYQIKSLPAVKRTRQLTLPLLNFDFETDRYNLINGYQGRAWDRLTAMENIEQLGDTVLIQDFTSGETVYGVIENLSFERNTPASKNYSGFGGIIYMSIRTV
jgi:hypothetical protein